MIKYKSVRTILAIAAMRGWKVRHFDIEAAYLKSEQEEEIYMEIPEPLQPITGHVCVL